MTAGTRTDSDFAFAGLATPEAAATEAVRALAAGPDPLETAETAGRIAEALARTADQLREDGDALDHFAEEVAEELADIAAADPDYLHAEDRAVVGNVWHRKLSRLEVPLVGLDHRQH